MLKEIVSTLAAVCTAMTAGDTFGQDLNAMNAAFNARLNGQMQATTNNIVQSNMNNPYVRQMYLQYQQQGGRLDFPSYCFRYAETGGFTPEGTARAIQSQQMIHQRDQANMNAYLQYSAQLQRDTNDYRNAVQDKWARQRGENLSAQATYVSGSDGSSYQLPTNATPGQIFQDRASGNYFGMDIHGQYWMSNGQGWWQPLTYRQ
ncbi:hypothetical protein [Schlesneria paludicola]|uniref:hypothetical protein n=1 Tax=Schlesneria paludicola TaxID=360056 RepID=UPI00029AC6B1|nr:hypothetical protein [Schlesneria paludicola]